MNIKLKIILLTVIVCFSFCSNHKENEQANTTDVSENIVELSAEQIKNAGIKTAKAEYKQLSNTINVNGVLEVPPQNLVSISAPMGGFVKQTELLQGMKVKKGQVLVIMEHADYIQLQENYIVASSDLYYVKAEYDRQKELNKENINSIRSLQENEMKFKNLKAKVSALEEKLRMINVDPKNLMEGKIQGSISIVSPIDGFVKEVNVNIGKYVNPTDVLFEIINSDHLHAELTVFEKDISKIKEGQKIIFTLPNENAVKRYATVHLIGHNIGADKTVRIHGHLEKEDPDLLPGMYIKADIETNNNKVLALPEKAIVLFNNHYFVFINKTGGIYQMLNIDIGATESGYTEVILKEEGNENSNFVIEGSRSLLAKLKNKEEE